MDRCHIMDESDNNIQIHESNPTKALSKKIRRAAEEVFVDESVQGGFVDNIKILKDPDALKRVKAAAGIQIISRFLPKPAKEKIKKRLEYKQDKLPFNPNNYRLLEKIGKGGMNDVFMLESQNGNQSYVLKVAVTSFGLEHVNDLVALAAEQKEDYDFVADKFKHIQGLVPEEYFIVANGPRDGDPSVITIQPFEGRNIRDIFDDFEPEELRELVSRNEKLHEQIKLFVETIDNNQELLEEELDLMGKNNLAIVGDEGEERLLLLDAHSISPIGRSPENKVEIADRVNRLREAIGE